MAFDGQRLRDAREAMSEHGHRVTQERFAEMIGVSRRSPGRWENGEVEPRMEHLSRIADVTGKPIDYFMSSEHRPPFRLEAA